jgi:hypothetical protein
LFDEYFCDFEEGGCIACEGDDATIFEEVRKEGSGGKVVKADGGGLFERPSKACTGEVETARGGNDIDIFEGEVL